LVKSCDWIQKRETRRSNLCNTKFKVRKNCPSTCGQCCKDDHTFLFYVPKHGNEGCDYFAKSEGRKFCSSREVNSACPVACNSCKSAPLLKTKPNILLILADDLGVGDIKGYWDDGLVDMPHIQNLVNRGTTFLNAHSTPLCAPSRYVLLSGNYQHRGLKKNSVWKLGNYNQFTHKQTSIAEILRDQGNYHTAVMGKWHLGAKIQPSGLVGDYHDILSNENHDFTLPIREGARFLGFDSSLISMGGLQSPPYAFFRDDYLDTDSIQYWDKGYYNMSQGRSRIIRAGEGATDWDSTAYNMILVNETVRFLDEHLENRARDPFFAYVALGAVHVPHTPPNKNLKGEPVAGQYPSLHMDMLLETDMIIGDLTEALEDRGLIEDTIIIFASDNGGISGKNVNIRSTEFGHDSSGRLRGYKGDPYEGGHRVPFIMRFDGIIPAGKRENSLIGLNDLYATLSDIAGINIPPGQAVDSISFADLIFVNNNGFNRKRRESLGVWVMDGDRIRHEALITPDFKLIQYPRNSTVELYNLINDLSEENNLSSDASYNTLQERLKKQLHKIGPFGSL